MGLSRDVELTRLGCTLRPLEAAKVYTIFLYQTYLNPLKTILRIEKFSVTIFTVGDQRHLVRVDLITFSIVVPNACKVIG